MPLSLPSKCGTLYLWCVCYTARHVYCAEKVQAAVSDGQLFFLLWGLGLIVVTCLWVVWRIGHGR